MHYNHINDFIDALWIMDARIYGDGTTQIPLSSPAMIGLLAQDPG